MHGGFGGSVRRAPNARWSFQMQSAPGPTLIITRTSTCGRAKLIRAPSTPDSVFRAGSDLRIFLLFLPTYLTYLHVTYLDLVFLHPVFPLSLSLFLSLHPSLFSPNHLYLCTRVSTRITIASSRDPPRKIAWLFARGPRFHSPGSRSSNL